MGTDGAAGSERPGGKRGACRPAVYDSFVVRLWRTPGAELVQRVEVEHVQSGDLASAGPVALTWVLDQLDEASGVRRRTGMRDEGRGTES